METITNLIIRACKSKDQHTRLKSVYRRFYLMGDLDGCGHLVNIMSRICEEYDLISLGDYVYATSHFNEWLYVDNPYNDVQYGVLLSYIRQAPSHKLVGYRIPARYRNKPKVKDVVI